MALHRVSPPALTCPAGYRLFGALRQGYFKVLPAVNGRALYRGKPKQESGKVAGIAVAHRGQGLGIVWRVKLAGIGSRAGIHFIQVTAGMNTGTPHIKGMV